MVNYIFDPEEKEYITVTRPYPYSVGCHGKPLFPAEIYRRIQTQGKTESQSDTRNQGEGGQQA